MCHSCPCVQFCSLAGLYFFMIARGALHTYSYSGSIRLDEVFPGSSRAYDRTFSAGGLGRFPRAANRDGATAAYAYRLVAGFLRLHSEAACCGGPVRVFPAFLFSSFLSRLLASPGYAPSA